MPISGIHSLYDYRIGAIEQIQHSDNYELKKGGHSAFYDHTEPLEETIPDFADYFIEAQQMLVRAQEVNTMGKDFEIRKNWYALFITIITCKDASEALRAMGIVTE